MENKNIEGGIEKQPLGILEKGEVQDFIKNREVKPEDIILIERLASLPKDMVISELHNLFNMYHERSGRELERAVKNSEDASKKELYETVQEFYEKYGWQASWNLIRLLENI